MNDKKKYIELKVDNSLPSLSEFLSFLYYFPLTISPWMIYSPRVSLDSRYAYVSSILAVKLPLPPPPPLLTPPKILLTPRAYSIYKLFVLTPPPIRLIFVVYKALRGALILQE